jgi:hypothetical protein
MSKPETVVTQGSILASNLSHDDHQCDRANVSTLSTHVTASDDLESRLLSGVDIVWDEFGLHDLLFDRMPSSFDSQRISELWLG